MLTRRIFALASLFALAGVVFAPRAEAVSVPANFVVDNAVPATTFDTPVGLCFLPDGRFMVTEQKGVCWMVVNGVTRPTPVWDGQQEISPNGDRGLLGIAIDPKYYVNHYVYFLYCVDPDTNGTDNSNSLFSRLTRYTMRTTGDTNTVDPSTRTILIGVDWTHGILDAGTSHSIGTLRFGRDGSLLISCGDGAEYNGTDQGGQEPAAFGPGKSNPYDDIGSFRAQDITNYNGKILRINPATGHGYRSNPFANSDLNSIQSKIWAYGMRNPFRFNVRPNTGSTDTSAASPGTVYIGDVGWNTWEEINVATQGGMNFGWPCMEGFYSNTDYQVLTPAHNGCGSVGTASNPSPWSLPAASWNHTDPTKSTPPGFSGITSIGGVFYSDTLYPASYRARYFFGDYGNNWIRVATFNGADGFISIQDFGTAMDAPVDLERSPINGDVYYVSITTGQIRHIRYTGPAGGNSPPIARATATPGSGPAPLNVTFNGSGSFDPENDPLTYSWVFGDGGVSSLPNPSHVYNLPGTYTATLTVNDGRGGQNQAQVVIIAGGNATFPTTPVVDNFNRANGPIGASWTGTTGGLSVLNNQLQVGADASGVFTTVYGTSQEIFTTLKTKVPGATELDLMLKVQGADWTTGHIEIWYDDPGQAVHVSTYHPTGGWVAQGNINGVNLQSGDQFGARAYANGDVDVYRNQVKLGTISVASWPFYNLGGQIGMTFVGASGTMLDDFGGGNWSPVSAVPVAHVNSPNGGESWVGGSSHPITWNAADDVAVTAVDIYYRDAATSNWTPLALGTSNTGTFTWFVPNTPTTHARVRVVAHDGDGNTGEDLSDADFTITRPAGGAVATTLRDFFMPGSQPLESGGFQTRSTCMTCHGGYDAAVEPGRNFNGSIMGQSARDPLFYACLAIAEQDAPSSGDLCIRCHSPFAWLTGLSQPTDGSRIDDTGRDGVACDLCHRLVDPVYKPGVSPPDDQAVLAMISSHVPTTYSNGQYVVDPNSQHRGPFSDPVTPHSFLASPFHEQSELCGTCHDVSNPVFTRVSGSKYTAGPLDTPADSISSLTLMPLERTFSEWKNSAFPAGVVAPDFGPNAPGGVVSACQDCHVRDVTGKGCNSVSAPIRNDLPLHDMTGGNAWMGGVIASLDPTEVDAGALADGAARAISMLNKAATMGLTLGGSGDSFQVAIKITNRTGHKLPTGYPEGRRMWLDVRVYDGSANLLYESGAYDPATGILAQDAKLHVYEAQLGLSSSFAPGIGQPAGASFHFVLNDTLYKDNRIPPAGFSNAAFAAFGGAPVDPAGPSPRYPDGQNWDTAVYGLPKTARKVVATLYYQTSSKEYVEFLKNANVTNTAGNTIYNAWTANGRSTPVVMVKDSVSFNQTGVPDSRPLELALRMGRNPFSGTLQMTLTLPHEAPVRMQVIDVAGRMVNRVSRGTMTVGDHTLTWDGRDASGHDAGSGVFWAVVEAGDKRWVQRVVRLR